MLHSHALQFWPQPNDFQSIIDDIKDFDRWKASFAKFFEVFTASTTGRPPRSSRLPRICVVCSLQLHSDSVLQSHNPRQNHTLKSSPIRPARIESWYILPHLLPRRDQVVDWSSQPRKHLQRLPNSIDHISFPYQTIPSRLSTKCNKLQD